MDEQFDFNDESNIKAQAQGLVDNGPLPKWSKGSISHIAPEENAPEVEETIPETEESEDVFLDEYLQDTFGLEQSMINQLVKNEILAKPHKAFVSPYTNTGQPGESCALLYSDSVVFMWRSLGAEFMLLSFENNEIDNLYVHEDAEGTGLLALCLQNGENLFVLWFDSSMEDDLNSLLANWDELLETDAVPAEEEELIVQNDELNKELTPKTIIFGALLINLISDDEGNLGEFELGILETIISNPSLFLMCIEYFEENSFESLLKEVNDRFTFQQRCMLITNMLDLVFRDGFENPLEQKKVDLIISETGFPKSELDDILRILRYKNDVTILESEIVSSSSSN